MLKQMLVQPELNVLQDRHVDIWSSNFARVEVAEDFQRAIITTDVMHVGPNNKGLYWTENMLKELASRFRGVAFRYDLGGLEGSSHTKQKLASPYFDVGWTYSGENGAWYDPKTKALWVKGEVTHPEVVGKLSRKTTDGKREVNYTSMGVFVEEAVCSICGEDSYDPDHKHERMQKYGGQICYLVPTKISKILHVALTNDPADGEAEIRECVLQEMSQMGLTIQNAPRFQNGKGSAQGQIGTYGLYQPQTALESNMQMGANMMPGGLGGGEQPGYAGPAPSPEQIMKDIAERVKILEQKDSLRDSQAQTQSPMDATPEVINNDPNRMTQDNMGVSSQIDQEGENMQGQTTNGKTPVNPSEPKKEMADDSVASSAGAAPGGLEAKVDRLCGLIERLLTSRGGMQTADMGPSPSELSNRGVGNAGDANEKPATGHMKPAEEQKQEISPAEEEDDGNKKNKAHMNEPGKVATADMSELETLRKENARLKRLEAEFQDSSVPEFGTRGQKQNVEIADMTAEQRRAQFGEFGAFEAIFNGPEAAQRFKR